MSRGPAHHVFKLSRPLPGPARPGLSLFQKYQSDRLEPSYVTILGLAPPITIFIPARPAPARTSVPCQALNLLNHIHFVLSVRCVYFLVAPVFLQVECDCCKVVIQLRDQSISCWERTPLHAHVCSNETLTACQNKLIDSMQLEGVTDGACNVVDTVFAQTGQPTSCQQRLVLLCI